MSVYVTIKTFSSFDEARIACSALKAGGFEASLCDSHVSSAYGHALDGALGGIRLQTRKDQADEAQLYLYALLSQEEITVSPKRKGENICPRCGHERQRHASGFIITFLSLLGLGQFVPVSRKSHYSSCRVCGADGSVSEEE